MRPIRCSGMLEGIGDREMGYRVFIDSFSGDLAELKRGKRTPENALAVLDRSPMVSTWDMSENKWLYRLICDLKHEGLIVEQEQPYPWHRYKLTDAGKARHRMAIGACYAHGHASAAR